MENNARRRNLARSFPLVLITILCLSLGSWLASAHGRSSATTGDGLPKSGPISYENALAEAESDFNDRRYAKADREIRHLIAKHPGKSKLHILRAMILEKQLRFRVAEAHLQAAMQLELQQPYFHCLLADLYERMKQPYQAAMEYDAFLRVSTDQDALRQEIIKRRRNLLKPLFAHARQLRIEVSIPQQRLFILDQNQQRISFPVSTGINISTPRGLFQVINKVMSPAYAEHGYYYRGGTPNNPLGVCWLGLNAAHYLTGVPIGIHGTSEPAALGSPVSRGCIRLHNEDALLLFDLIPLGCPVRIADR